MNKQQGRRRRTGGRNRQQNKDGSAFTSCVKERKLGRAAADKRLMTDRLVVRGDKKNNQG
jgi:hypothetical protein